MPLADSPSATVAVWPGVMPPRPPKLPSMPLPPCLPVPRAGMLPPSGRSAGASPSGGAGMSAEKPPLPPANSSSASMRISLPNSGSVEPDSPGAEGGMNGS